MITPPVSRKRRRALLARELRRVSKPMPVPWPQPPDAIMGEHAERLCILFVDDLLYFLAHGLTKEEAADQWWESNTAGDGR